MQTQKMPIASHLAVEPSPTLGINERVKALWAAGETVYHFGFGESRFPVHPKLQAALAANAHQKGYLPVQGLAELRETIAAYNGRFLNLPLTADQIIVGPGSKALLFGLLMALDADLLLPSPSWVSYAPQARMLRKPVYQIPAAAEDDYALTLPALAATVAQATSATKVMVINSPNNPTGRMFTAVFLQQLADFCRQHNIIVISDEIYSLVPHGQPPHVSLATYYPEGTIIVGGLSKHLSLGGWRLGKAILPAGETELRQALLSVGSEIWSAASAPIQYAALVAYSGDPDIEAYIQECAALHAARTQHIWSWLSELGIRCPQPQGGFYMMPDFMRWQEPLAQRGVTTSADLSRFMLEEYRLATLPGAAFGLPDDHLSLRMATSFVDMENDAAAERVLASWRAGAKGDALFDDHHPVLGKALGQFERMVRDLSS